MGNDVVRATVAGQLETLAADDSRSVSAAATKELARLRGQDTEARPPEPVPPEPSPPEPVPPEPVPLPPQPLPRADAPALDRPRPEAPAPEPDIEHALADWTRNQGGPVPQPAPERAPGPSADQPEMAFPVAWFITLIVVAVGFLLLARLVPVDSTTSYYVTDITGLGATPWALWVGVALMAATQLVLARNRAGWPIALGVGLVAGVALVQLGQLLVATAYFVDADSSYEPGPDLLLAVPGTAALLACVALGLRRPPLRGRWGINRTWRGAVAAVVLVGALVAWLDAFADFYLWPAACLVAFLMAAVALTVAGLSLSGPQRLAGLAAVTVFGGWLASGTLHGLLVDNYWSDAQDGVVVAASALVSVAACYLAQARLTRAADRPAAGAAAHR
jgi:hypothetical protein